MIVEGALQVTCINGNIVKDLAMHDTCAKHDTGICINDIQEVVSMSSMWDGVC